MIVSRDITRVVYLTCQKWVITLRYVTLTARRIMFKHNIIIWLIFIQDNWVLKIWWKL